MTRKHWRIVGILAMGVLLVYCLGAALIIQMMLGQPASTANVPPQLSPIELTHEPNTTNVAPVPTTAAIASTPTSSTPVPTAAPTYTRVLGQPATSNSPIPAPTATWVLGRPPVTTPANATAAATSVPRTLTAQEFAAAGAIQNAWTKSSAATIYRLEMDMTMKGGLSGFPGVTDPNQEMSLLGMTGEVNGKDSHFTLKGFLSMFLGGDANKGIEMMTVGGKSYIHGPVPMLGAPENKWYVSSGTTSMSAVPKTDDILSTDKNTDWASFKKSGTETLDGKRCDVYSSDKLTADKLLKAIPNSSTSTSDALSTIDMAELKAWICDDGYLHQITMNMDAHSKEQPSQKVTMRIRLHFSDLNGNIKITAPANAVPAQMPSFITTPAIK